MKNILYCNFLRSLEPKASLEDKQPRLFAKYFPKYIKKISFSPKDASVRSRVKRTKIIQEVSSQESSEREFFVFLDWKVLDWKILLGNKIKSLKTFSDSSGASHKLHQELKLFSGLKSFSICFPLGSGVDDKYWKRVVRMMNYLRNLKSLSISNLTDAYSGFLMKLNSSTRLLSSLAEFRIILKAKAKRDNEWYQWYHNFKMSELLSLLSRQRNILKHVTCLNLSSLADNYHFICFQDFAGFCPKLETLSFEFYMADESLEENEDAHVEVDYLGTLKAFQSLKSLELGIGDLLTCLKCLVLPPSIQHLALNFKECLGKEILQKIDGMLGGISQDRNEELSRIFEENPTLVRFYESFKNLELLESLDLSFKEDSDTGTGRYQSSFQNGLLKRVPMLQKFTSHLAASDSSETDDSSLPQFFESLSKNLKTLEFGNGKTRYTNFDLSASRGKFTELSTIKFTGVFDSSNLESLGDVGNFVFLGNSLTKIQPFIHMDHYVRSFLSLLEYLSKVKTPEKLKVGVEVWFLNGENLEDLKEEFEEIIGCEQMSLKARRISLKVNTEVGSEEMKKFLDVFGKKFRKFEIQARPIEDFIFDD